MRDLVARLELLLRGCAAACDEREGDVGELVNQFRRDLRLFVAEYGPNGVDAALDAMPARRGRRPRRIEPARSGIRSN